MEQTTSLKSIDPLSFTTVRIQTYYDNMPLSNATGFFYYGILNHNPNYWLVTNWHVLTGRNIDDPGIVLHRNAALPNRLRLQLIINSDQPEYASCSSNNIFLQEQFIQLYDSQGKAVWYQHKDKNMFDVAVINYSGNFERFHIEGINKIATHGDMAIQIGNKVFILGYPLGFTHFVNTPIWKSGSIASEPNLETSDTKTRVVIDATTRQGMSGAPVIMREKTHYVSENGEIKSQVNATRWIGIYSSRPNLPPVKSKAEEDSRAEIGYFYKMRCVYDTILHGISGPDFGSLP